MLVGQVEEVFSDSEIAKFQWKVGYFSYLNIDVRSPAVTYFRVTWQFEIRFYKRPPHRVYLTRKHLTAGNLRPVRCSIGYKKADGTEEDLVRNNILPVNEHYSFWNLKILQYATPSDELILTCTLWKDALTYEKVVSRIVQVQGASCAGCRDDGRPSKDISILQEHLRDMRLSGDDHDFLFKVKGEQFRAHKCVLRARSPVFAAMFRSQMVECEDHSVTVDDCDPDAFGEFLSYVYTGKADISSASHALGLYYAGEKYDFPRLKEMSVLFLKNSLTPSGISDVISLAVRHDEEELLQQALVYLATNLEDVWETVEWQRFLTANPIQAHEMCMKALKCVKKA